MSGFISRVCIVVACAVVWFAPSAFSACIVSDTAADPAYADGWQNGDEGGIGWGTPWQLVTAPEDSSAGYLVLTSTANGDGDSNGDGDIDVNGVSWTLHAPGGAAAEATRSFSEPLVPGNTLRVAMDSGWVEGDGAVGLRLLNDKGQVRLEFALLAGDGAYTIVDAAGSLLTGVPFTDEGLVLDIAVTGPNAYTLGIADVAGGIHTNYAGLLAGDADTAVIAVGLFNDNANPLGLESAARDACFNSILVSGVGPSLACPPDTRVDVPCNSDPVPVTFPAPSVEPGVCPVARVECVPPSGSVFAPGLTPVTCRATDAAGQVAEGVFHVLVNPVDDTPPVISAGGSARTDFTSATLGDWLLEPGNIGGYVHAGEIVCLPPYTNADLRLYQDSASIAYTGGGVAGSLTLTVAWLNMNLPCIENYALVVEEDGVARAVVALPWNGLPYACRNTTTVVIPGFSGGRVSFRIPYAGGFTHMSCCRILLGLDLSWDGPTAWDDCEGDLSDAVTTIITPDPKYWCLQHVTYNCRDSSGNEACPVACTLTNGDATPPQITLLGENPVTIECGGVYVEAGAVATDDCAGDLTGWIVVSGTVDTYTVGVQTVTYLVRDIVGHEASVTRTVNIVDTTPPVITVPEPNPVTIECDAPHPTAGATAWDIAWHDLTRAIRVTDEIQSAPGTYQVRYVCVDRCGNTATAARTVTVVDSTPPVITCPPDAVIVATGRVVAFAEPVATDNCDPAPAVTCDPPSGSVFGPGLHTIIATATDHAGNTSQCSFTITVLPVLQVVFQAPLSDDNTADEIETDADVANRFKVGATVPHKVKLYDVNGNDVTRAIGPSVTVRIDVTERLQTDAGSLLVADVPEDFTGVGDAGGILALSGDGFQFNLATAGFEAGTAANSRFFRSLVTVSWNVEPSILVGAEDTSLESKP